MMKQVFFDTNVLIDFLADRKPFSLYAAKLFNESLDQTIKIYVSAVSFNNVYYILRQSLSHSATLNVLSELHKLTEVIEVNGNMIENALKSDFTDFEDAIQYQCAKSIKSIDCIVTRDPKGFKLSTIPILAPNELISLLASNRPGC